MLFPSFIFIPFRFLSLSFVWLFQCDQRFTLLLASSIRLFQQWPSINRRFLFSVFIFLLCIARNDRNVHYRKWPKADELEQSSNGQQIHETTKTEMHGNRATTTSAAFNGTMRQKLMRRTKFRLIGHRRNQMQVFFLIFSRCFLHSKIFLRSKIILNSNEQINNNGKNRKRKNRKCLLNAQKPIQLFFSCSNRDYAFQN